MNCKMDKIFFQRDPIFNRFTRLLKRDIGKIYD